MNSLVLEQFKEIAQEKKQNVSHDDSFDYIKEEQSNEASMSDMNSVVNYNTRQSSNYQSTSNRHFNTLLNEDEIFEKETHNIIKENRVHIINPNDNTNFWDKLNIL